MSGMPRLGQFPGEFVHVECQKCDRSGRYRTARLVQEYGTGFRFIDFRAILEQSCELSKDPQRLNEACGIKFPDMVSWLLSSKPDRT